MVSRDEFEALKLRIEALEQALAAAAAAPAGPAKTARRKKPGAGEGAGAV